MTEIEKMAEVIKSVQDSQVFHDGEADRKQLSTALFKADYRHEAEVRAETAKEFAEKIKKALEKYRLENEEFINGQWIINASILCAEFTNGILDEIAASFGKGE